MDLVGQTFGRLTVLAPAHVDKGGRAFWKAKCECGSDHVARGDLMRKGGIRSCGCWKSEMRRAAWAGKGRRTHGLSRSKTHGIWASMKSRCLNPNVPTYKYYGGRGIRVCESWMRFENFYRDMGDCPPGYSIERRDVNGDYHPDNCEWIPRNQQAKNRRYCKTTNA
jgi:hypothetical protein